MKKIFYLLAMACCMVACQNDDTDFSAYTDGTIIATHVINIAYDGNSVKVTGDDKGYVTTDGADVTVNAVGANDSLLLVLEGICIEDTIVSDVRTYSFQLFKKRTINTH